MSEQEVDLLREEGMGGGSGMSERLTAVTIAMHFYANIASVSLFRSLRSRQSQLRADF